MRVVEEPLFERLRRQHLPPRGPHRVVELGQQTAAGAVGGDDDLLGREIVQRLNATVVLKCDSILRGKTGKSTYEARRLHRAVGGVEDSAAEVGTQVRQVVAPVGVEAVGT